MAILNFERSKQEALKLITDAQLYTSYGFISEIMPIGKACGPEPAISEHFESPTRAYFASTCIIWISYVYDSKVGTTCDRRKDGARSITNQMSYVCSCHHFLLCPRKIKYIFLNGLLAISVPTCIVPGNPLRAQPMNSHRPISRTYRRER